MKTINRAIIDTFIDLFHAAAMLLREQRIRTPSLELTPMGTSSRGAKEKFRFLGTQYDRRVIINN